MIVNDRAPGVDCAEIPRSGCSRICRRRRMQQLQLAQVQRRAWNGARSAVVVQAAAPRSVNARFGTCKCWKAWDVASPKSRFASAR